ncbi:unnamed protein product, partial [Rotaria sordida]
MCQHQVTFTNLVPSLAIALIDYLSRLKQRFSPSLRIVISTEEEGEDDGVGELFIGGPGVFQGYLNRGPNPDDSRLAKINEDICYRTGDLVKVVNGELAYVGRRDFQVKIR